LAAGVIAGAAVLDTIGETGFASVTVDAVAVPEARIAAEHLALPCHTADRVGMVDGATGISAAAAVVNVVIRVDAAAAAAQVAGGANGTARAAVVRVEIRIGAVPETTAAQAANDVEAGRAAHHGNVGALRAYCLATPPLVAEGKLATVRLAFVPGVGSCPTQAQCRKCTSRDDAA
jgi:hypothetical protein